jgi:hypothetical protein
MINNNMLTLIKDVSNPLLDFVKDDPVRPEIPKEFRVSEHRFVATTIDGDKPKAMVCVSLQNFVPTNVDDLAKSSDELTTAIFYTIWSYAPGAAADLLFAVVDQIKQQFPTVNRFVTLSPKTEMARRFHYKNGATTFRENEDSINYEYSVTT